MMKEQELSSNGCKEMNSDCKKQRGKQMRFKIYNLYSAQPKKADSIVSDLDTDDHTVYNILPSNPFKDCSHRGQHISINIPNIPTKSQQNPIECYRRQEKAMIKAFSKTHPPMSDHSSTKQVVILEAQHSELFDDLNTQEAQQHTSKFENKSRQSIAQRLSKPSMFEDNKSSLQLSGQQEFLFPGTDSVIVNSLNSHEESATNEFIYPKQIKSNNDYLRKPAQIQKDYLEIKHKSRLMHSRGDQTHFQAKSQKKVTFIGDTSMIETEGEIEGKPTIREKSETINSIKDSGSMTSILHHHSVEKRPVSQQGSRKIISQDDNYCLFRLMNSAKLQRLMMCRSVQIKDEMTEYKELKLYLLSRENQHRNIVKMHSYEKIVRENRLFVQIKMNYYPKNLEEYTLQGKKNEKRLRVQRKIILFQILKAINFIHSKGIYHRDLNPHSIMITDRLHVAITNFAYVKQPSTSFSSDNFYQCNFYIRPPEVILQPSRGFESGGDIWGFGCIVVYMLKGQMPFFKAADSQLLLEIIKLLGPPSAKYLERIHFKGHKRFIFPRTYRKSIRSVDSAPIQISGCDEADLLEMLKDIFRYEPTQRPTAAELMSSQYFCELRDESTFRILSRSYEMDGLFDFNQKELSKEKMEKVVPIWYPPVC